MTTRNETRRRPTAAAPEELVLEQRHDGQLWALRGDTSKPVVVVRCFPWSDTAHFISLRDHDEAEFALIEDPGCLDATSRAALEENLARAGFVLEIERILSCEEEVEIRTWEVETRQGRCRFQTRRDDWPRTLPDGSLLVRDVAGDLFVVREPGKLDPKSRHRLWAFQE